MNNQIHTMVWAAIDFPDSGWSVSFQKQENEIAVSLHWNGKLIPTHQVKCDIEDFKNMLDKVGVK